MKNVSQRQVLAELEKAMNKRLDEELVDALQATEQALKQGKDHHGENEDPLWWKEEHESE